MLAYSIAAEPGSDAQAWDVVVPDLPGCYSAAEVRIDQAIENAKKAIQIWIESTLNAGKPVPQPTSIANHLDDLDLMGFMWVIVCIDPDVMDEPSKRINISLPHRIIKRLGNRARAAGQTCRGCITYLALTN